MSHLVVPVSPKDHMQGLPGSVLTLVEYGDFQCPHCRMAHGVVRELQDGFGDAMLYVYRNFPLTQIHPLAEPAAEAAEFAAARGKYWQMHDAIFAAQDRLSPEMLLHLARGVDLNPGEMARAMEEQSFLDRISADVEGGEHAGVHGTPTFFINNIRYEGPWDVESLAAAMDAAQNERRS